VRCACQGAKKGKRLWREVQRLAAIDEARLGFVDLEPVEPDSQRRRRGRRARCHGRPRVTWSWLCGSGRFAFRGATTPLVDIAQTPWACWPGYFGEASTRLEVQAAKTPETTIDSAKHFVFVAGPRAPLQQAETTGVCRGNPRAPELTAASG
jgi:hypothetical protein